MVVTAATSRSRSAVVVPMPVLARTAPGSAAGTPRASLLGERRLPGLEALPVRRLQRPAGRQCHLGGGLAPGRRSPLGLDRAGHLVLADAGYRAAGCRAELREVTRLGAAAGS